MLGGFVTVFVFGAFFMRLFDSQWKDDQSRRYPGSMRCAVTKKGFVWAVALPACWVFSYYAFIVNIRLSLGRWPKFGEALPNWQSVTLPEALTGVLGADTGDRGILPRWSLAFQHDAVVNFLGALVGSLYFVSVIFALCLFFRRWRYISIYAL